MANRRKVPEITDAMEARIQRGIAADPDSTEMTDEQLAGMRPASEVLPPALYVALTKPRGRPRAEHTKMPLKLRLDRDAVQAFKATGAGWQTRMNAVLVRAAKRLGGPTVPSIGTEQTMAGRRPSALKPSRSKRPMA